MHMPFTKLVVQRLCMSQEFRTHCPCNVPHSCTTNECTSEPATAQLSPDCKEKRGKRTKRALDFTF